MFNNTLLRLRMMEQYVLLLGTILALFNLGAPLTKKWLRIHTTCIVSESGNS